MAPKGMIALTRGNKEINAGVWNQFFSEARDRNAIIDGDVLNGGFTDPAMAARFNDVSSTWASYTQAKAVSHANVRARKSEKTATDAKPSENVGSVTATFVSATGATDTDAGIYLKAAGGVLHVALDAHLREHGSDDPVYSI